MTASVSSSGPSGASTSPPVEPLCATRMRSPGAKRAASDVQLATSDAGTTSRAGARAANRLRSRRSASTCNGLAETHVVGEAHAETELVGPPEPAHAVALVRTENGLQVVPRVRSAGRSGRPQAAEHAPSSTVRPRRATTPAPPRAARSPHRGRAMRPPRGAAPRGMECRRASRRARRAASGRAPRPGVRRRPRPTGRGSRPAPRWPGGSRAARRPTAARRRSPGSR